MEAVDVVVGVVAVLLSLLLALMLRRQLLRRRGATAELSMRLSSRSRGRGWALGVGRYDRDELSWYKVFSFSPRPNRVVPRSGLQVVTQRRPTLEESRNLLSGAVVVECRSGRAPVQLAMSGSAIPGFLAWCEASPETGPQIT